MSGVDLNLIIKNNPFFYGLSKFEQEKITNLIYSYPAEKNNKASSLRVIFDTVLIVCNGEMTIQYMKNNQKISTQLIAGDVWFGGELKGLDLTEIQMTASANANVFMLRLSDLYYQVEYRRIYNKLHENVGTVLDDTRPALVQHNYLWLFNQDELEKRVVSMQHFISTVLLTLTLYIFFLHIREALKDNTGAILAVTLISLLIMLTGIVIMIRKSDFSLAVVGLTLTNTRVAIKEALISVIPLLLITIAVKYILITFVPQFKGTPLFDFQEAIQRAGGGYEYLLALLAYSLLSVPLQELVFRGGIQGFLQQLFAGSKTMYKPIIIANIVYSTLHLIISPVLAITVFFPGLYWGWLFSRHNNLIGVCISHALWGATAFFIVNYLDLLGV